MGVPPMMAWHRSLPFEIQNALVSRIPVDHIGGVPRTMDNTAATPSPVRLLVSSATEAEKIREYAAAWIAFERSVARFQRTKRWQVVQRRASNVANAMGEQAFQCLKAWFAWQTVRAFRACDEMATKNKLKGSGTLDGKWHFDQAQSALYDRREVERELWIESFRNALLYAETVAEAEAALLKAARPVAAFCQAVLKSYENRSQRPHHADIEIRLGCARLATFGDFDAGQLTAMVFPICTKELAEVADDPARFPQVISDEGVENLHQAFLLAGAAQQRLHGLLATHWGRREAMLIALQPRIAKPAANWHEARFYRWLFQVSFRLMDDRLWVQREYPDWLDVPVADLLNAPLCWQLWLHDRWEDLDSAAADILDGPARELLCQLVESPGRFLRFPNPSPGIADLRRMLRPLSALLEGYQAPAERTALSAALRNPATTRHESVHLLSVHCARRWGSDLPPNVRRRYCAQFDSFLRDEIVPQAPDILRSYRVEVGAALQSQFDADFGKLLVEEEASEAAIDAALSEQRDSWRQYVPASEPAPPVDVDLAPAVPSCAQPLELRYILNLGEPVPKEVRLASTRARLAEDLEQFCERHGISVNIPFSSVAHAIEHYCFYTPEEKKRLWPQREKFGPIELHKIKRGALRVLVRESDAGLWLHLLQRRDWFLGSRR